ncbi:50S ribosomal protein L7/L12 [candidate division WOR-3 bacterium]|uniref:Large ribosomal subunit protein bL12 n=1 Tax=candidate division WOR-3 bacterium TaxID=2052148 RepID=A0A9D5K8S9_UNCW3|nr:50S ribosomal protein L7/L12 [candidate division WOR-3 bacterium]MBD3364442.1 50S ribosomal protein L7/L12 [candidate division WOR-3 bacterium]
MSEEAAKAEKKTEKTAASEKAVPAEKAAEVSKPKTEEKTAATATEKKPKKTKAKAGGAKLDKLVEDIGSLTVLELAELVDTLKERFNIEALTVAPAAGGTPAAGGAAGEAASEKSDFDIVITDVGGQKLQVLKEVRSITGLGLKEAKDVIDNLPGTVKEAADKDEAEEIKKKLEAVGAKVELK